MATATSGTSQPQIDFTPDFRHDLISSRRVEGTPVYNSDDEKLGTVRSLMIGKQSGQVAYAVLSFGGFLGIREHVHPVPWELLRYDIDRESYVLDLSKDQIRNAPSMHLDESDRPRTPGEDEKITGYYGTLPWWGL